MIKAALIHSTLVLYTVFFAFIVVTLVKAQSIGGASLFTSMWLALAVFLMVSGHKNNKERE